MRLLAIGVLVGLMLAAVLQVVCRPELPEPSHAVGDSLQVAHTRDSLVTAQAFQQAQDSTTAIAASAEPPHSEATRLRAKVDTLWLARPDSSPAFDTLAAAYDSLEVARARTFAAYRGAVETASIAYTGWMKAEGALSLERGAWEDEREGWRQTLHRAQRRRQWAAGILADERLSPAGAWVSRDVGPLTLSVQVLRESGETRGYLGAGVRF